MLENNKDDASDSNQFCSTHPSPDQSQSAGVSISALNHPLAPDMSLFSSDTEHTLRVMLPREIGSEMITISANKGNRLRVMANAWQMEGDGKFLTSTLASTLLTPAQ
jgi:hypothetical protein